VALLGHRAHRREFLVNIWRGQPERQWRKKFARSNPM
jgi:hypothetical protein